MKRAILLLIITVCVDNYAEAQTDTNKNKFDTILIKHDPGNNKNETPDSTNERKKKPPVQKTYLNSGISSRKNGAIIN
jgi:hypothetical protein